MENKVPIGLPPFLRDWYILNLSGYNNEFL